MLENLEIRPKTFEEFIGQKEIVETLRVLINSANKRKKILDHILFYGGPGLGKTTLAHIIAQSCNGIIKFVQGPLLEKKSDILSLFGSIQKGNIIFIDEIHNINKNIEELLYSAMEEYVVDIPIGVDGENKIMRMKLPEFTLIGATTKINLISQPLKDRFGFLGKLKTYTLDEIAIIIKNSATILKINLDDELINYIATYTNATPRIANNLLKRIRDFAIFENTKIINKKIVDQTLKNLGIYHGGLNYIHIEYLEVLNNIFKQKTASLDVLSGILKENKDQILINIEPKLLEKGFIEKTSKGRKITTLGIEYLTLIKK